MHRQRSTYIYRVERSFRRLRCCTSPEERIERARVPTNLMEHRTNRDVTRPRTNRSILDFTTRRCARLPHTRSSG